MSRLFGWSLPPGCSSLPGENEPEYPCGLCGHSIDDCTCPECETCGANGCFEHLDAADLFNRFREAKREIERRGGERKLLHDLDGCDVGCSDCPAGTKCEVCGYVKPQEPTYEGEL